MKTLLARLTAAALLAGTLVSTATREADFLATNQRIEFAAGERERRVIFQILDDGLVEAPEFFTATLSNPTLGTVIKRERIAFDIVDNEHAANYDVSEPFGGLEPLVLLDEWEQPAFYVYPLDGGGKFIIGRFSTVNGVERPLLAKLDANDELDPAFRFLPPPDFIDWDNPHKHVLVLRSGGVMAQYFVADPSWSRKIIVLNPDGSIDARFAPIVATDPERIVAFNEGADGVISVLVARTIDSTEELRLVRIRSDGSELPSVRLQVTPPFWSGVILADGSVVTQRLAKPSNEVFLSRFFPDGSEDLSFKPISGEPVGGLPDGRIVVLTRGIQLADTRDISATAGKDYVPQSGTVNFAPLEVEKIVEIPILADAEDEIDEELEVVVTGAEGFEELPAPMRLTISSPRLERPWLLDRARLLPDGRVLLGVSKWATSWSADPAEPPIEF